LDGQLGHEQSKQCPAPKGATKISPSTLWRSKGAPRALAHRADLSATSEKARVEKTFSVADFIKSRSSSHPKTPKVFFNEELTMLRAILVVTPFALAALISCGDSGSDDGPGDGSMAGEAADAGASSGGTSNQGGKTSSDAGTPATSEGGTPASGDAGAPTTSIGGAGASPDPSAGGADTGAGGDLGLGGSAACPDLFGDYTIKTGDGMCGTLNKAAPQAIEGDTTTCTAHFVSAPAKGAKGINGTAEIGENGSFSGATLMVDVDEQPCTGKYNAKSGLVSISCGEKGGLCNIVLEPK
jgi:hypothetical protein